MFPIARASAFAGMILAVAALTGCRDSGLNTTEETSIEHLGLRELGEGYRLYSISKNKPPTKLADLNGIEGVGGNGLDAVRKGDLVLRFGAALPDTGEAPGKVPSSEVLAWEKKVESGDGYVLMLDRTIKKMTAAEFAAAAKAGVEAPAEKAAAKK